MAGIPVTDFLTTTAPTDTYATHLDVLGQGGHRAVFDVTARNAISTDRRKFGMLVTLQNANPPTTYVLCNLAMGGNNDSLADNTNWKVFASGGSGTAPYSPLGRSTTNNSHYIGPLAGEPTNLNTVMNAVILGSRAGGGAIAGAIQNGAGINAVQLPGIATDPSSASLGGGGVDYLYIDYASHLTQGFNNGIKTIQSSGDGSFYGGDVDAGISGLAVRVSQGGNFARLGNEDYQHLNIDTGQQVTQMRVGGQVSGYWTPNYAIMGQDGGTGIVTDWSNSVINMRVGGPQVATFSSYYCAVGDVDGNYSNHQMVIDNDGQSSAIGQQYNNEWRVQYFELIGRINGNLVFYGNDSYDGSMGDINGGGNGWSVQAQNSNDRLYMGNDNYGSIMEMNGSYMVRLRQGGNTFLQSSGGDTIWGDVDNSQNSQAIKILQNIGYIIIGNPNNNTCMVVNSPESVVHFSGLSGIRQYGYDEFQIENGDTGQLGMQLNWNSRLFRFGDVNQNGNGTRYEIDDYYKRHGYGTQDGTVRLANLNGEEFINANSDGIKIGRLNAGSSSYLQVYDALPWLVTSANSLRFVSSTGEIATYSGNNYYTFIKADTAKMTFGDPNSGATATITRSTNVLALTASNVTVATSDLEVLSTNKGLVLHSPNNTRYRISVSNTGALTTTAI